MTIRNDPLLRPRAAQKRNISQACPVEDVDRTYRDPYSYKTTMPIYHRHYPIPGRSRQPNRPANISTSRLALFLPVLMFGTILSLAFLHPAPPSIQMIDTINPHVSLRKSSEELSLRESRGRQNSMDRKKPVKQQPPTSESKTKHQPLPKKETRNRRDPPLDHATKKENQRVLSSRRSSSLGEDTSYVVELAPSRKILNSTQTTSLTLFLQSGKANHLDDVGDTSSLSSITFPSRGMAQNESHNRCETSFLPSSFLPIDDFPEEDPYLPWIHDYWYVKDGEAHADTKSRPIGGRVRFVAQNKRRCQTGKGKDAIMKHWEPQVALFQSIPVAVSNSNTTLELAESLDTATVSETRFLCHFHSTASDQSSLVTFSQFNFNYEYILWRKRNLKGMFVEKGKDVEQFELSQLLFSCPVPLTVSANMGCDSSEQWFVDLVPLRTSVRRAGELMFSENHVGPNEYKPIKELQQQQSLMKRQTPSREIRELVENSGRWANLPLSWNKAVAPRKNDGMERQVEPITTKIGQKQKDKPHNFVLCTWTAASYFRRGDETAISDSERRLREWIIFHQLVGVDHIYVYDNSQPAQNSTSNTLFVSPLKTLVERYFSPESVSYIPWPCQVCSNNRPNHPNPGERSSQYAAEASCRERFGPETEWMAFIDTDEYLVPMMMMPSNATAHATPDRVTTWTPVLEKKRQEGFHVLKMRSSRGRPRRSLMETFVNDTNHVCRGNDKSPLPRELCVQPLASETFLRVYNCEYIRPPKPDRFQRAMKQIYRPEFVLSHYVHYSTITKPMTEYYSERTQNSNRQYTRLVKDWEWGDTFLDDVQEGCLVHTKSVLPYETIYRSSFCLNASKHACPVGLECPDSTAFVDEDHTKNIFHDESGNYCNCWINHHLEDNLIPRLEKELKSSSQSVKLSLE